jgi:hypothetical protein
MAKKTRKKTINQSDRVGTRKFLTVAGAVTLILLIFLYFIYSMS